MRLTDEELDFLAATYASNRNLVEPTNKRPSAVSELAKRLLDYGFITEERKPKQSAWASSFWLIRPSLKGLEFVRAYDPAEMIRAFVRTDCLPCAILWIYNWMKSLGELPEFIAHEEPDIRNAARIRFEELVRDYGVPVNES